MYMFPYICKGNVFYTRVLCCRSVNFPYLPRRVLKREVNSMSKILWVVWSGVNAFDSFWIPENFPPDTHEHLQLVFHAAKVQHRQSATLFLLKWYASLYVCKLELKKVVNVYVHKEINVVFCTCFNTQIGQPVWDQFLVTNLLVP